MTNEEEINLLAYQGKWERLISVLSEHSRFINVQSQSNGYTPLHQAAWHGATLEVIGVLLSLGADCRIKTTDKQLTALNIAVINHPERADLVYALSERRMTIAQLIRKVIVSKPDLFGAYDGNQVLADRFIRSFGVESCPESPDKLIKRFEASFRALTGVNITSSKKIISLAGDYDLQVDAQFWKSRFFPILREFAAPSATTLLEKEWAVVSDLFDPAPEQWGLRGDLFLWMEMRQALCHVPVPENPLDLADIIRSAFHALTGEVLGKREDFYVRRFARGGMSGGGIYSLFWSDKLIPMLEQRLSWLQKMWGINNESRRVR
ncbi:MAG: ankyrin repeat domain-containing protein [Psychromonas sp.]